MTRYAQLLRPLWASVALEAVSGNVREIRRLVGEKPLIMAVVKAEAYGHGAVQVAARTLAAGATWLGVSLPEEGINLRAAGIEAPILILSPLQLSQAAPVAAHGLAATICQHESAEALSRAAVAFGRIAEVHLKVDTGMGRVGIGPEAAVTFASQLAELPGLKLGGVFSHLAKADEEDKSHALRQIETFMQVCASLRAAGIDPGLCHLANSAAIVALPQSHLDLVRAGIILYGLKPSAGMLMPGVSLQPALSLAARVIFVKRVPSGTGISYGLTYRTPRSATIATIPIGYADGWSRLLSDKAEVLIHGRRYPIVGRICMDQCMVNLGDDDADVGDEAVLIGRQGGEEITAEEVAEKLGTINYEVVCMIGDRVPRVYV